MADILGEMRSRCLHHSLVVLLLATIGSACSVDSAKNHYLLAERLWTDKNYPAAISEFEKVIAKDRQGKLGLQALYRAAMTQALFLSQYPEAIKKFKIFIQKSSDQQLIWQAQLQIGDLFFSKLEMYQQAIDHYAVLLKENPNVLEAPEFRYRIAKSQYFAFRFTDAINSYEDLIKEYPKSSWAEKASFEIGLAYLTRGEQDQSENSKTDKVFLTAMAIFQKFLKDYPDSSLSTQARFGIASSLESLDRLDEAYQSYAALKESYGDSRVIDIKLHRIKERINHKTSRK